MRTATRLGALAAVLAAAAPGPLPAAAAGGAPTLRICAGGHAGFSIGPDPLAQGPITVPRGAAFRFSGLGLDLTVPEGGGASDSYAERHEGRRRRIARHMSANAALMAERAVTLTRAHRCGSVPAAALLTPRFGWSRAPVRGDGAATFGVYGVVGDGHLDLSYGGAGAAFRRAAIRGEIEARFTGETRHTVRLKRRELDVIARHRRR